MKISLNWLKQFVDIPKNITPEELGIALTLKTVEVEGIKKQGENSENIVVGKIKKIEAHPNADKLKVCFVDIGEKEDTQIVCGGINLREGMFTVVAKVGAKVRWHGEGDMVELKKVKLRGVESNGMICTASELGLENIIKQEDEAEIVDLEKYQVSSIKYKAGEGLAEVLGLDDIIFDIDNKSLTHRPDLWSHYGIAREVAAIYGCKFAREKPHPTPLPACQRRRAQAGPLKWEGADISVDIKDKDLCPRYMALAMSGIKIAPSPQWMQNRLRAVGMRSINNIVDITNFVMLEVGQPMHAFDKSKVCKVHKVIKSLKSEIEIIVRRAGQGEKIITLDGEERILDDTMLVIADEKDPIAIAGVMGGENSEIDENTTEIILESANFNKVNNRKTSSKLGLRTEAVMRYEKGLDPNLCEIALARCVELIKEIIPTATVSSDIADVETRHCLVSTTIEISLEYIQKKMGVEIKEKQFVDILTSLGFEVEVPRSGRDAKSCVSADVVFKISVPSWRATGDINIPDDIVEEVARIYGYDDIKSKMPIVEIEVPLENSERDLERKIKNILSYEFGMAETSNYSFVSEKAFKELGYDSNECVKLANPISSDFVFLRPSLVINLLENVKKNLRYFDDFKMFEIGPIFKNEKGEFLMKEGEKKFLPWQEKFISGIVVESGKDKKPFYVAKEIVDGLLNEFNIDCFAEEAGEAESWMHPYRKSKVKSQKSKVMVGYITELNPVVAENIGIKNARVGVFNLSLKLLLELSGKEKKYKELPKYPSVARDLAVVVNKEILYKDIVKIISGTDKLIKSVELFDIFESEKLGKDKKCMAFHITFFSDERTLTDGEVEKIFNKMTGILEKELGAKIRG